MNLQIMIVTLYIHIHYFLQNSGTFYDQMTSFQSNVLNTPYKINHYIYTMLVLGLKKKTKKKRKTKNIEGNMKRGFFFCICQVRKYVLNYFPLPFLLL